MKWLLITNTENRNPGDEWIRIGVERMVRDVDPSPKFIIKNKEFVEDQDTEVEFDRAIWCGSPLFWSHTYQGCWENYWWDKWIHGWLFKEPRKILVLGVGDAVGREIHDKAGFKAAVELVKSKCWMLVTRNRIACDEDIPVSCCPSVFALMDDRTQKSIRLCNLMPDGAHDPIMNEDEAKIWREKVNELSKFLAGLGFEDVCHANFEEEFLEQLGWPHDRVHRKPKTAEEYLPVYAKASVYVGNRMHGAMLAIGAGGASFVVGYDSRVKMVEFVGGTTTCPSKLDLDSLQKWLAQTHKRYDCTPEYDKQVVILRRFAES